MGRETHFNAISTEKTDWKSDAKQRCCCRFRRYGGGGVGG